MKKFMDFSGRRTDKPQPDRGRIKSHVRSHERFEQLKREKRDLIREYRLADEEGRERIRAGIRDVDDRLNAEILRHHLYSHGPAGSDLNRYYRHIRVARPLFMVLNLIFWGLLFWFGGASATFKAFILFFAILSTVASSFELSFLMRVKKRILTPVEELEKGVEAVASGNYDVKVERKGPNEIDGLISAFNGMADKLREDEQVKAEYEDNRKALIANISHDLKTPMTSIEGYVEALLERDDLSEAKKRRYLKVIANNTDYMRRLIDDLFLFSKLDMQKLGFDFEKMSVRPFLRDMMEESGLDLDERHISFSYCDELEEDVYAKLDAKRFHQIIVNIMGNAVKYGPREGLAIDVRLYRQADDFCIDIRDNGPGIPREKVPHIFEQFYRVDDERTKDFSGTGLGLAISRELAEAHGGRVSVASSVGEGTCFTLSVPLIGNGEA